VSHGNHPLARRIANVGLVAPPATLLPENYTALGMKPDLHPLRGAFLPSGTQPSTGSSPPRPLLVMSLGAFANGPIGGLRHICIDDANNTIRYDKARQRTETGPMWGPASVLLLRDRCPLGPKWRLPSTPIKATDLCPRKTP
jgi:hypothetical protein